MIDWNDCLKSRIVKSVSLDNDMIKSLLESSDYKSKSESMLKIGEVTATSKVSLAYDSLRELLEALSLSKGFKIYNHECYTAFLKSVIRDFDGGEEFDSLRIIRNNINYYGRRIAITEALEVISRIKALKTKLNSLLR